MQRGEKKTVRGEKSEKTTEETAEIQGVGVKRDKKTLKNDN